MHEGYGGGAIPVSGDSPPFNDPTDPDEVLMGQEGERAQNDDPSSKHAPPKTTPTLVPPEQLGSVLTIISLLGWLRRPGTGRLPLSRLDEIDASGGWYREPETLSHVCISGASYGTQVTNILHHLSYASCRA